MDETTKVYLTQVSNITYNFTLKWMKPTKAYLTQVSNIAYNFTLKWMKPLPAHSHIITNNLLAHDELLFIYGCVDS
jgi:hypothetical protein